MNGCHVPGQTGAIQNPAYRPTGDFPAAFFGGDQPSMIWGT
ncbi:hypothetical protein X971_2065 [Agrobacterium tumefaciens LBA4213 (Ach5)]|nr:hypothetical protein X971_2065 [Agrobacterium tumefaciens LBA4213 (Ach5)]